MHLNEEQLKVIEEMSYRCFSPDLIAINIEVDEVVFSEEITIPGTNVRKAFYTGLIRQQNELREAMIKAAHNGSNPAQEQIIKMLNQLQLHL